MQILNFTNISFRVTLAPSIGLNVKLSHVIYSKQSILTEKWTGIVAYPQYGGLDS